MLRSMLGVNSSIVFDLDHAAGSQVQAADVVRMGCCDRAGEDGDPAAINLRRLRSLTPGAGA